MPLVIAPHLTVSRVMANYLTVSRLISQVQGTPSYISYLMSQVMACFLQVSWATTSYLAVSLSGRAPDLISSRMMVLVMESFLAISRVTAYGIMTLGTKLAVS